MTDYESDFWGTCVSTWHEEQKQFAYAKRMGLRAYWAMAHPPSYDVEGKSIIDIGGGPVSLLLKCVNLGTAVVADPAQYPDWVIERYRAHGVSYWKRPGEELAGEKASFDEAWIYNVLTHVDDPSRVIQAAWACAPRIRIFDWIDQDPYPGHPQRLTQEGLEQDLGSPGFVSQLAENGAVGRAFYGVFDRPTK